MGDIGHTDIRHVYPPPAKARTYNVLELLGESGILLVESSVG